MVTKISRIESLKNQNQHFYNENRHRERKGPQRTFEQLLQDELGNSTSTERTATHETK